MLVAAPRIAIASAGRLFGGRLAVFPGGNIMKAVRGVFLSAFPGCDTRGCQGRWGAGPVVMARPGRLRARRGASAIVVGLEVVGQSPPGAPGGVGRGGIGGPVVGGGPGEAGGVPLCGVSSGCGWFRGWLRVVEGSVADHGVQGEDAAVGQGEQGLAQGACPGPVCAGSRYGRRDLSGRRRRTGTWRV